jgi:hypothetical protein
MTGVSYDDLVAVATVGLSRRPLHLTGLAGPAAEYARVLDGDDPAAAVLDAAALLVAARRAGNRPATVVRCPAPAPADAAPELPARAADVLEQVRVADPVLLADLLSVAGDRGFRVPPPLLPALLDAAVKTAALRPAVAAVLGARGRWLAGHRAGWQRVADTVAPAVPDDPGVWETGSRGERRAYLALLRGRDQAGARELLAAGWARETGHERADLLAVLASGLSAADEAFLEDALDDRQSAVRAIARHLLGQLPGSAFTCRAAARAEPLLRVERRGLRRRLVASLPEDADASAARDGIGTRPPPGIGPGAWLLTELIAAAPLTGWVTRFGLDAGQIVSLAIEGNFGADVHAGWRLAAVSQASPEWAEALLAAHKPGLARNRLPTAWPPDDQLAALLPPGARAERAVALLTRAATSPATIAEVDSCPGPWPDILADAVIAVLRHMVTSPARLHPPGPLVAAAARNLPVTGHSDHAAALARLANASTCPQSWPAALRQAASTVALRRAFLEEIR